MASLSIDVVIKSGPHRYETGRKQATLALGGIYIVSTTEIAKPLLVWETEKGYARYYVPIEALHSSIAAKLSNRTNGAARAAASEGETTKTPISVTEDRRLEAGSTKAVVETLTVGKKRTTWVRFLSGPFENYIRYEKEEIDQVFENGALSPAIKNPYKRIDTTAISRRITILISGTLVASSNIAILLNETGLPETYYLPATSIKYWGMVEKSDLRTACPYKGEASYLHLTVDGKKWENVVWYYQYPTHESAAVEGFVSFYRKEGVEFVVDGVTL